MSEGSENIQTAQVGPIIRIPVRRLRSATTHLADVSVDQPGATLTAFGADFWAPIGPVETLCMVTLPEKDVLVHMRQMGTAKTDPKGCPACLRLAARDPKEIVGPHPKLDATSGFECRTDGCDEDTVVGFLLLC